MAKYNSETYQRRKAEGICVNCGKHPAVSGRVRCLICSRSQSYSDARRYNPETQRRYYVEGMTLEKSRAQFRLTRYGLTQDAYDTLWMIQGGCCAICGKQFEYVGPGSGHQSEHVDHDSTTGQVRGLLCGPCNRGIGYLKHDNTILHNAADYLMESA